MANRDLEPGQVNPQNLHMVNLGHPPDAAIVQNQADEVHEQQNPEPQPYTHRDFLGRITQISNDLARYVSPTYAKVFQLKVQATEHPLTAHQGEWHRVELGGDANPLIRVAVWAVGDLDDPLPKDRSKQALLALKILFVLPAMMILMPLPLGAGRRASEYPVFFGRSWDYPKYPRNLLDGNPRHAGGQIVPWIDNLGIEAEFNVAGNHNLLLRPRKLMVKQLNNRWRLVVSDDGQNAQMPQDPNLDPNSEPYIVISYTSRQFRVDQTRNTNPLLERLAEDMAAREGVRAYWIDYKCRARDQPELTYDVHRICDVFRGACQVYAAVPDLSLASKRFWGSRMWCLPEARMLPNSVHSFFYFC